MPIDRKALVSRHNPRMTRLDPSSPLSVGNGRFAFTADITGLQTFPGAYEGAIPLCTMAEWGWHEAPPGAERRRYELADLKFEQYDARGRKVGYPTSREGQEEVYYWLRMNPHKFHLGRIGLDIALSTGEPAGPEDVAAIDQTLDLWRGVIASRFSVEGRKVATVTCCHPVYDLLAFTIRSELLRIGRLKVQFAFPYPSPAITGSDWENDEGHYTAVMAWNDGGIDLARVADDARYFVRIAHDGSGRVTRTGRNSFALEPAGERAELSFVVAFSPQPFREPVPGVQSVVEASERYWERFWTEGGAVELAESRDPRAWELERRVVLSQYLTAIQCSGSMPPQETGLTCNSWHGKFHLEMHWWHAAHFALWGRERLLERSLWWYSSILPRAREAARAQGYQGARWPKMVGPDGRESPSPVGPLLVWQQPHVIYFAELLYRARPTRKTLETYCEIVFETAAFMASYAAYDEQNRWYSLGPPIIPAQENHAPHVTVNPSFELEYWSFGLRTACAWRERLGLPPFDAWLEVADKLAPLPVADGVYVAHAHCPDTFLRYNWDHPSMLGALGVLPGRRVDPAVMSRTLDRVWNEWQFDRVWGWDFPLIALTAARLGRQDLAVRALLYDSPKNVYLANGHNRQGSRKDLPLYLPGNGALLLAVGMMAAGWDGCPSLSAPGFPQDGSWRVCRESVRPLP